MTRIILVILLLQLVVLLTAKYTYYLDKTSIHHVGHDSRGPRLYDTECTIEAFKQYQKDNNRVSDEHDEERRQRLCDIIERNHERRSRRAAGLHASNEEGITSMSDLSPEEYRRAQGLLPVMVQSTESATTEVPITVFSETTDSTIMKIDSSEKPTAETTTDKVSTTTAFVENTDATISTIGSTEEHTTKLTTDSATDQSVTTTLEPPADPTTEPATTLTSKTTPTPAEGPFPEEFDWRNKGFISPIKNQNPCGSCWAFATVAALEAGMALKAGTPDKFTILSEQHLVDCANMNKGCSPGNPVRAMLFIANNEGISTEESYPYVNNIDDKTHSCKLSKDLVSIPKKLPKLLEQNNEESLKKDLVQQGPIIIYFDSSHESFKDHLNSGVYEEPACGNKLSNMTHAMLLVGYGTDPEKGDYWTIKNSWGENWGEKGYIRTARNKNNHCGVATSPMIPDLE